MTHKQRTANLVVLICIAGTISLFEVAYLMPRLSEIPELHFNAPFMITVTALIIVSLAFMIGNVVAYAIAMISVFSAALLASVISDMSIKIIVLIGFGIILLSIATAFYIEYKCKFEEN